MDQLRIFIETSFFHDAERILGKNPRDCFLRLADAAPRKNAEREFIDVARRHVFVLSDDSLRLIYRSWRDIWGIDPDKPDKPTLLNALVYAARRFIRMDKDSPCVDFRELFRWRDFTRCLGEDIYICAYLAWLDRDRYDSDPHLFSEVPLAFPPCLPNDNPDIRHMKSQGKFGELHCHLGASAKVLDINWISLMNNPAGRSAAFRRLVGIHNFENCTATAAALCDVVANAAAIRFHLYRMLDEDIRQDIIRKNINSFCDDIFTYRHGRLTDTICAYKGLDSGFSARFRVDYIAVRNADTCDREGFAVYTGERRFLYLALRHAIRSGNNEFQGWLLYYILAKNMVRKYMVQLNSNHGFSNFQRYQDTKSLFLNKRYSLLPAAMAIPDACRDSGITFQEVRIAPRDDFPAMVADLKLKRNAIDTELAVMETAGFRRPDYSFIYHFIKKPERVRVRGISGTSVVDERNHNVRRSLKAQCRNIQRLACDPLNRISGIDAASSEFNCRPEVFGQAFRFLHRFGLKATFHAGEDFYDLADGIRAIDEAVTFLGLESGDRIGHALAMGIDAGDYYASRNNRISIPTQWLLDNIVWLYCRGKDWNVGIRQDIERYLLKQFRVIFNEIYVESGCFSASHDIDIETYHLSMLLRGNSPALYNHNHLDGDAERLPHSRNEWEYYAVNSTESVRIAAATPLAVEIYRNYHFNYDVRRRGNRVKEFHICPGYTELIMMMQEKMMERVERHGLCVECCPSSNLLIGSLSRFERHPIFRFHGIDPAKGHHLPVTINTDDLGVFQTSLANEYSYLALAQYKSKHPDGTPRYSHYEISEWLKRVSEISEKYRFSQIK